MAKQGLEHVLIRNEFYLTSCRRLSLAIFLLLILILGLIGFAIYQSSTFPMPKYFATTADGIPIHLVPLNVPLQTDEYVINWTEKTLLSIYSLDFVNYRRTLQDAQAYFTTNGYFEFRSAYQASNNLNAVKDKKQVVSAEITGPSKLLRAGQLSEDSPYSWNLEVPMTITYQNSENDIIKQIGTALVRVERASLIVHLEGLAIAQLILQTH